MILKDADCRVLAHCKVHVVVFFLLEDGKKSLPIISGISTTPGTMIYAGSIGTQIANELLDFNRCVSMYINAFFTARIALFISCLCSFKLICVCVALG